MTLLDDLTDVVGREHVLTDPDTCAPYENDITGRFRGRARAVVRPGTTAQVAELIRVCGDHGEAIVTQGGNTGLVGGGVPRGGEVVLQVGRLAALDPVEPVSAQVNVGAGATLATVHDHARAANLDLPIDHGARSSATIGGMVATNAGGTYAVRYGTMRAQVAGLEYVTGTGTVVDRMSGITKDNAGYDAGSVVIGSEGTLAVITGVRLRLVPLLPRRVAALFAFESLLAAQAALQHLRLHVQTLVAADFFLADGLRLVCRHRGLSVPFGQVHDAYLVVELASDDDPTDALAHAASGLAGVLDIAVADDRAGRDALWAYRELHNEVANAMGVPHKADISVRLVDVPRFASEVVDVVRSIDPSAAVMVYGHLGDGNVHVNVIGPPPDDHSVDEAVLQLAGRLGGTISAEHGVGVAKARYLPLCRSGAEIDLMRRIKRAFDPLGTLNPECVLSPSVFQ